MSLHLPCLHYRCLSGSLVAAVVASSVALAQSPYGNDPGGIIFIGDSITQGGNFNSGLAASYRYQLFRNFVDNGITYNPMGTTQGASGGVDVSGKTPDYRGYTFSNVSEAAASGRSYQYAGHDAGSNYKTNPGTVRPAVNAGPLSVKFGLEDPYTHSTTDYYNGSTLTTYTGDTYAKLYGDTKAQTAVVMIGINDIYDMDDATYTQTHEQIVSNINRIITTLQSYNKDIHVVVAGLLPVGQNNGAYDDLPGYNSMLKAAAETWSTATSTVTYADLSEGFYATNGAMIDTARGAHPNAQGELIVAGNLARVLGVGQRNLGYERRDTANLASHADLSSTAPSISLASADGGQTVTRQFTVNKDETTAQLSSDGKSLTISSPKATQDNYIKLDLGSTEDLVRTATYNLTLRMNAAGDGNDNVNTLSLFIGDGKTGAGILNVREDGILWGETLLYGSPYEVNLPHTFTLDEVSLRVVVAENADSTAGVYHVWLGDQLIGENLTSSTSYYKDNILIGRTSASYATYATISDFSVALGAAYAPSQYAIPEPASATLSLLALTGLAARRRRR